MGLLHHFLNQDLYFLQNKAILTSAKTNPLLKDLFPFQKPVDENVKGTQFAILMLTNFLKSFFYLIWFFACVNQQNNDLFSVFIVSKFKSNLNYLL